MTNEERTRRPGCRLAGASRAWFPGEDARATRKIYSPSVYEEEKLTGRLQGLA